MADKKVHLQIITPVGIKVDENVDMVIIRATTGDMGFLPGHESRSAILDVGVLRMIESGQEQHLAIFGGLAEIKDDKLTIITSLAEMPEEIDRARAENDLYRAEQRSLQEGKGEEIDEKADIYSANVRMRRSMVRIEVSSYPLLSSTRSGEDE